jgi:hypothetical protein
VDFPCVFPWDNWGKNGGISRVFSRGGRFLFVFFLAPFFPLIDDLLASLLDAVAGEDAVRSVCVLVK